MPFEINQTDKAKEAVDSVGQKTPKEKRLACVKAYIEDHYIEAFVSEHEAIINEVLDVSIFYESASELESPIPRKKEVAKKASRQLSDLINELDDTFSEHLLKLIDQKGKTDVETYKRANLDRKLFSKIRSDQHYQPSKSTALALAIALELNLDETKDLLQRAGFALSHSSRFDLVIEYFITEGVFHIGEINEILFEFNQPLLGR